MGVVRFDGALVSRLVAGVAAALVVVAERARVVVRVAVGRA